MRKLILIFLLLPAFAFAQDKQQPKASDKPIETKSADPPAEAFIEAKAAEPVQRLADAAAMAALRAENLGLKIEQAREELKRLIDEMNKKRDEANAAFNRAAIKAGIPGDKINEYTSEYQKDGSIKMTRKPQPPAK